MNIYLVTTQKELFKHDIYTIIGVEQSIAMLNKCNVLQFDTETDGLDPHISKLLCIQFGSREHDFSIVVDCSTINILKYKDILNNKEIIGHNLKFDLKFLYNYNITPNKVYDTMIVERLLYLGYPHGTIGIPDDLVIPYVETLQECKEDYIKWDTLNTETKRSILHSKNPEVCNFVYNLNGLGLNKLLKRYLNIDMDKSIRTEIASRGLDVDVIKYAAYDVIHLEDLREKQERELVRKGSTKAAILENSFVRVIAYLEWCGIKLDVEKWTKKMEDDLNNMNKSLNNLNQFILAHPTLSKSYVTRNLQGDLFEGFDTEPKVTINWSSSQQVVPIFKKLGFNTTVQDKKTNENKESVLETHLKSQKGINDAFLKDYLNYKGYEKVVTSFGQGFLNAVNPKTGRLYTEFHQLGGNTGRMSCGSSKNNNDLAKLKKLPINPSAEQKKNGLGCGYKNIQQLPHDALTRSCFIAEDNNLWLSCDYAAIELINLSYT